MIVMSDLSNERYLSTYRSVTWWLMSHDFSIQDTNDIKAIINDDLSVDITNLSEMNVCLYIKKLPNFIIRSIKSYTVSMFYTQELVNCEGIALLFDVNNIMFKSDANLINCKGFPKVTSRLAKLSFFDCRNLDNFSDIQNIPDGVEFTTLGTRNTHLRTIPKNVGTIICSQSSINDISGIKDFTHLKKFTIHMQNQIPIAGLMELLECHDGIEFFAYDTGEAFGIALKYYNAINKMEYAMDCFMALHDIGYH